MGLAIYGPVRHGVGQKTKQKEKEKEKGKIKMKLQKINVLPNSVRKVTSKMVAEYCAEGFGDFSYDEMTAEQKEDVRAWRLAQSDTFVQMLRVEADDLNDVAYNSPAVERAVRSGRMFIVPEVMATEDKALVAFASNAPLVPHRSMILEGETVSYHDHLAEMVPGVASYVEEDRKAARKEQAAQELGTTLDRVQIMDRYTRGEITLEEMGQLLNG